MAFSTSLTMASRFILSEESSRVAAPSPRARAEVTVRVSSCTPIFARLGWRRVKLLIRASGVFFAENLAKSG